MSINWTGVSVQNIPLRKNIPRYVLAKAKRNGHRFIHIYIWVSSIPSQIDKCNQWVYVMSKILKVWIIVWMKHLENKMACFSTVWKNIGQITHLSICDGIDNAQMFIWINLQPLHFALAKTYRGYIFTGGGYILDCYNGHFHFSSNEL